MDEAMGQGQPGEQDMSEAGPSDMVQEAIDQGGGYKICIVVKGSKSFSVYKDGEEGENELADEGEPIGKFEDALRAALRIYKENPPQDAGAEDQFQSGFSSGEQKY